MKLYKKKKYKKAINLYYLHRLDIGYIFEKYINSFEKSSKKIDIITKFSKEMLTNIKIDNIYHKCKTIRLTIKALLYKYGGMFHNSKKDFRKTNYNINYIVIIGDTDEKNKLFCLYLMVYYLESMIRWKIFKTHKKSFVGIDYEFAQKKIALMQINFETVPSKKKITESYIWLVNPGNFNKNYKHILVEYLMKGSYITKILHGADSLDIPYMYNDLLIGDNKKETTENILIFTKRMIDTRFLCEYFRISVDDGKKCSIYDALLYFKTITKKKYNDLLKNHDVMGPVQNVSWDIYSLKKSYIKYATYDVLYLIKFLEDIYTRAKIETKLHYNAYKYIPIITRLVYITRADIIHITSKLKKTIDKMNNYYIKTNNKIYTFILIYTKVIENMWLPDVDIDINILMRINYFKSTLTILFKTIIYSIITNNFIIMERKDKKFHSKLSTDYIFKILNNNTLKLVIYVLKIFYTIARKKIILIYK